MKLEQSFSVQAPIDEVWAALIDVERIAPCLPGAEITGQDPDGAYGGTFTVKLGPTTASYRGSLRMEAVDEAARTVTMSAKGTDRRGQGGASATIVSTMREEGGATSVDVLTDFHITGRLARFGRSGMIEDISRRLMRDFSTCLQTSIGGGTAAGVRMRPRPRPRRCRHRLGRRRRRRGRERERRAPRRRRPRRGSRRSGPTATAPVVDAPAADRDARAALGVAAAARREAGAARAVARAGAAGGARAAGGAGCGRRAGGPR